MGGGTRVSELGFGFKFIRFVGVGEVKKGGRMYILWCSYDDARDGKEQEAGKQGQRRAKVLSSGNLENNHVRNVERMTDITWD